MEVRLSVKVHCRTNLDNYQREVWPTEFACPPHLGDRVESASGKFLKIVRLTHCSTSSYEPYVLVELNR